MHPRTDGYGLRPGSMATLIDIHEQLASEPLGIGCTRVFQVTMEDLRTSAEKHDVRQERGSRLWLRATIAGRGSVNRRVYVDERILKVAVQLDYRQFVATDTLLGFPPQPDGGSYIRW